MVGGYSIAFTDSGSLNAMTGTIPESVVVTFQITFEIITPALVTGAFADRMKFSAMLLFMSAWVLLVYSPVVY